jgi:asparagine synthase (glutamine-hydrolysing)
MKPWGCDSVCGIAGICGLELDPAIHRTLGSMLEVVSHRGPDGQGFWIDSRHKCALAHQRLAIIDLELGDQPMPNEDESLWITFNGCIYNYLDLARTLRQRGHVFRTHSDTEVIVHAFEEWGPDCVHRFNGMWAFAIWDANRETLFCSRDRLGIKPLYYTRDGDTFLFASEIKSLVASGFRKPELNPEGLRHYLVFQYCLNSITLFNGIEKLEPGHNLILKPGERPRISCYWDLRFQLDEEHEEEYFVDRLRILLQDSVRLRLLSDVPLGMHLSGGLDSSALVCISRLLLGDVPMKTFTGGFKEGSAYDETPYAEMIAQWCQTEHFVCYPTARDFIDSIEKIVWHMDEPAAGPGVFPQYWVSKLASDCVKVILGGQGGDEVFIGYARYLVAHLEECLRGAIRGGSGQQQYAATLGAMVGNLSVLDQYVPMLQHFWSEGLFDAPAKRYFRLMDRFSDTRSFISGDVRIDYDRTFEEFRALFDRDPDAGTINRMFLFDLKTHLQSLLHVEDRTSMAWSLESRVPLLDYRLVELMAAVPPMIKFRNGSLKHLFKKALETVVPDQILDRKDKMGFPVPLAEWIGGDLREFVADLLLCRRCRERVIFDVKTLEEHLSNPRTFGRGIWGALCLELWFRQMVDSHSDLKHPGTPREGLPPVTGHGEAGVAARQRE